MTGRPAATGFWDKKVIENPDGAKTVIYRLMGINGKAAKLFVHVQGNIWQEFDADALIKKVENA